MSERTVAEDTLTPAASTTCWEPTGWAEPMYSLTTALRMAALRASRSPPAVGLSSVRLSSVVGMGVSGAGASSDLRPPVAAESGAIVVSTPL